MIKKLKEIKFTKKGIYISLAICMLLVGGIGIFSAIRNMNKVISDADFEYEELSEINSEGLNTDFFDSLKDGQDSEPVISQEVIEPLKFVSPINGELLKKYSGTELVYSETMNDYRTHTGVDIASEDGNTVVSVESGEIVGIENHPLWGTCIEIEHRNGYSSCYKNLNQELPEGIEVGSYVTAGGIIGSIGTTALVEIGEQPHLHFEMQVDGNPVNPLDFINIE